MGDTKVNGLLEKLDKAWTKHIEKRADVRALVRVMGESKPRYILFCNPRHHEEMHGGCNELSHAYGSKFDFQLLDQEAYDGVRARLQPRIDSKQAVILYESKREENA